MIFSVSILNRFVTMMMSDDTGSEIRAKLVRWLLGEK